jgi:hypothetical protein
VGEGASGNAAVPGAETATVTGYQGVERLYRISSFGNANVVTENEM